ncbi:phenylalanine--tRNA ligase beta subunit-related protein [Pelosinus sp. IPA-1]|uniref:B3/B4 domain-containing protein n=1 Tax=Pelosinus sp. IPA-1 TaxID=3029569 RepID=UPI00243621DF|nr:phenylalanine--tRNA ligase beta subunit-related protein [Pelosinus sp. IPA-1]GMB00957.1 hypothetical protein PIPA1_37560 [Pelosinus sp. IPA-1]
MQFDIQKNKMQYSSNRSLGYLVIRNIVVQGTPPSLAQEFFHLQIEAAKFYNIDELMDIPPIVGVRSLKKVEFNPVRHTTASEEVVRRVLQRKGVHYVNSAVAVANYCAIKFLLPFGLYDLDQIAGNVSCQLDVEENDKSNSSHNVTPLLVDDNGIFGNPMADAARTAVTLATRNILVVIYADGEVEKEELKKILTVTSEMMVCYNGGSVEKKSILEV